MIVTEEEAKTKWCPHATAPGFFGTQPAVFSRQKDGGHEWCACLGSDCMMWRWIPVLDKVWWKDGEKVLEKVETNKGYCALAGHQGGVDA